MQFLTPDALELPWTRTVVLLPSSTNQSVSLVSVRTVTLHGANVNALFNYKLSKKVKTS